MRVHLMIQHKFINTLKLHFRLLFLDHPLKHKLALKFQFVLYFTYVNVKVIFANSFPLAQNPIYSEIFIFQLNIQLISAYNIKHSATVSRNNMFYYLIQRNYSRNPKYLRPYRKFCANPAEPCKGGSISGRQLLGGRKSDFE